MRIRKNAKLCGGGGGSVLFGLDDNFQTHVCQLNQSPWDVIPLGLDSYLQFDGDENSFTENGCCGDSVGAVESVASMMDAEDQTKPFPKIEDMVVVHNNEAKVLDDIEEGRIVDETTSFCQKTDGKNWHCKNDAKPGQSFCDHHLSLLRSYSNYNSVSYNSNNTSSSKKATAATSSADGVRRGKARAAKRASSSSLATSNPYEFYYYSGFGPLWGKRRGDRNGEGSNNNHKSKNEQLMKGVENSTITETDEANEETNQNTSSASHLSSSSQMTDNEEFDYGVDDDDEDEDDNEEVNRDGIKKRMRKPVKARSLKSLM